MKCISCEYAVLCVFNHYNLKKLTIVYKPFITISYMATCIISSTIPFFCYIHFKKEQSSLQIKHDSWPRIPLKLNERMIVCAHRPACEPNLINWYLSKKSKVGLTLYTISAEIFFLPTREMKFLFLHLSCSQILLRNTW